MKFREKTEKIVGAFATAVVKKRLWFVIAFALLFVAGAVGFFFVNTNYDSTAYLPEDSEIKQGLRAMYAEFGEGGNASVMAIKKENGEKVSVSYADACSLKTTLREIDGVADILWLDDLFGSFIRTDEKGTEVEYAEVLLLLLRLSADMDFSTLSQTFNITLDTEIKPEVVAALIKGVVGASPEYKTQISTGNYSFDQEKGKKLIENLVLNLLKSDLFKQADMQNFDIATLQELVAGFRTSVGMFYAADENGVYSPLFQVSFSGSDYDKNTMNAIESIRNIGEENGYSIHMSGNAATTYNSINCVETQTLYALIAVGAVVLVILFLFSTSFWEPILYLLAIGVAVVINMGSNVLLGSVSYLTSGVAGILQMALSMDYSIFILTRFKQEKEKTPDVEQAMINAVKASLSPIGASSLTTVASFIAIMFMSYTIGLDMGIVFAKGVILSLLSVFMLLPGLAIYTNKWIEKSQHKSFKLTFKKWTKVTMKGRKVIPIVALVIIITACVGQYFMKFGYGDTATFGSEGSLIYKDKQQIESVFGCQNQLAVLISREATERKVATDGGDMTAENAICQELSTKRYVITAQSAGLIESSGMAEFLPDKFLKQFDNGGEYKRMVMYLDLAEEGEETERAVNEIRAIFASKGVEKDEYFMLGGSSSALEIKEIVNVDYRVITWISVILILLILFLTFRNVILPFLLVFVIQGSIWISMSVSVLTGDVIVFLGYLIVSAVMLGATIDYGILLTSNYLEMRKTLGKFEAIEGAIGKSTRAILTSSVILCCAGIVITLTSTMPAIVVFGELIARTAAASMILVLGLLPCLLVLFDKLIAKTTFGGANFYQEEPKEYKSEMQNVEEKQEAAACVEKEGMPE